MQEFRIYITGSSPEFIKIIEKSKHYLSERTNGQYSVEVLDVLENPRKAAEDQIIVTPTILRISPLPQKKVIGDMHAWEQIFDLLLK